MQFKLTGPVTLRKMFASKIAYSAAATSATVGLVSLLYSKPAQAKSHLSRQHENLMGTWIRDTGGSDSIEGALSVMRINPFLKVAMRQLKGIELQHSDTNLELTLLSRFSWLRLQERYPLSCQPVTIKRRDFRGGGARAALSIDDDAFWIDQAWGGSLAGHGSECAWSPEPGVLYIDSTIKVHGKTAQYRQVYHQQ